MKTLITRYQRQRIPSILNWVTSNFVGNRCTPSKTLLMPIYISQNPRLYRTTRTVFSDGTVVRHVSPATMREAQAALLEYLHSTRSFKFLDAEHMSKNSPHFLQELLKKVEDMADVHSSIARYLRYHPVNEFELFFESLGLKPCEYTSLLPQDLMFLSDDELLLENYHVFCNYGIARSKIGKIYKQANEIFRYDFGVLQSKLQAYEELGLSQSLVAKVIVCSPYLLIGEVNVKFIDALALLQNMGIELIWIEEHLCDQEYYNWSMIFTALSLFSKIGFSEEQLGKLIRQHPGLIFEGTGDRALVLVGFLLKFGTMINELDSMFLQFPQIQVGNFILNLRRCRTFLFEIGMQTDEITNIIRSHAMVLGTLTLKKPISVLVMLKVGKKRLCEHVKEYPLDMKKWVRGSKMVPFPSLGDKEESLKLKTKFLRDVGLANNSDEMEKALKVFKGRGGELQGRFDCLVKAGLDRTDVCKMIKVSPQILNMSKSVIEMKIDFLVNGVGYPLSYLVAFPSILDYTVQRVKLRFLMYNWLIDQGAAKRVLSLSTIVACSPKDFLQRYVDRHPAGLQVWENLKKQIYSE